MKKFFLLFFLMLSSCASEGEQKLIPKDDFTKIHGEVLVIESYYQLKYRSVGIYKDSLKHSIDKLLKNSAITLNNTSEPMITTLFVKKNFNKSALN